MTRRKTVIDYAWKELQVHPQCPRPFYYRGTDLRYMQQLEARRLRARRRQRLAIALCVIAAILIITWEVW